MITPQKDQKQLPDFSHDQEQINTLLTYMHEIADLDALQALAAWDQNTTLPDQAGEVRGHQLATIQGVLHERWTNPQLGSLLDTLDEAVKQDTFTDADRGLVREARRAYDQATKLPRSLVEEIARTEAGSFEAWRRARFQNDFASFAPWLTRTVALQREVADRYGYQETRYDALLDLFEPGLTVRKVDTLFTPVREISKGLLQRIQDKGQTIDASILRGHFESSKQDQLCDVILRSMGYDFSRGQLAHSPHPFTSSFGSPSDVRLTIHPQEDFLASAIMAGVHEGGHAVYEQGVSPTLLRTQLASGASMGMHESQSRLWENYIGRSDAYWQGQFSAVREAFPEHFANVDAKTFAQALNMVEPSLVRIEADEVTYNLHIIIRYELERELVNGNVAIESLPGLWNAKYREYLGVEPESDVNGVMQDVHWTSGFGYFPSYTLGNLYGAQFYYTLRKTFPDLDARLASGETGFILDWLRVHMYAYGSIYLPEELMKRVTGEAPTPDYFVRYLNEKFGSLYQLNA